MRFPIRPFRLNNQRSRRFGSRHLTLLSILLVLGVAAALSAVLAGAKGAKSDERGAKAVEQRLSVNSVMQPLAVSGTSLAVSPPVVTLGTAENFGVLGGSTVTNAGATTVNGNVGVSPGSSVTGFPPGVVAGGAIHANDAVAMQAQNDLTTAYNNTAAIPCTVDVTGKDLGGLTLTPGIYCFSSSAQLTGALTLDALGNSNSRFVFKIGGTLTTANGSSVTVINGGSNCDRVIWQVGISATLGAGSSFVGDILALNLITLGTGASTTGKVMARNGAVTLDTNNVNSCGSAVCPIITVNPASLPNGTAGTPYNQTVSASGGTAPHTFAISIGSLPNSLLLNSSTGAITGTPTTAGTFSFTITATDAIGCSGNRFYSISIASPGCPAIILSPSTVPPGSAGIPYNQSVTAGGGTAPYTYSISSGSVPGGLTLNPATGAISGTPTPVGLFNFQIGATDAVGCQGARQYSLLIVAPPTVTVNAGPDIDAANNDYRRIQNAVNAAVNGDTIILSGTFDFTAPFAAAAWAAGNDGIAGNSDDYEVSAPRGINNVTLTANSLGSATIQGPGDLPALDLESFLVFDASLAPGGGAQGWTISNLRILDFDLSIGMFAVGLSDYNNTTITNNFVRIPNDLNATVAPSDALQNIGLHFSFGTNQSITGNSFQTPGDGVSDTGAGNFSTIVVMQSNQSGGAVYNGLSITGNVTHILNAQSANPQVTLGIWDNCQAHTSNITISNNSFLNDAVGNSPSLNLERAFRVTSHSGASSLVKYDSNTVNGANIGFQWITGSNFAGNQAVVLTGNQITNSDTGVLIQSNGIAHFENNVITGSGSGGGIHLITGTMTGSPAAFPANPNSIYRSFVSGGSVDGILIDATAGTVSQLSQNDLSGNTGFGLHNLSAPLIVAESNWWGNNLAANVAATVSGPADFDPWLASGTDISASTGFQPFIYATTTTAANLTTLAGTAAADTGSMLTTSPVTLTMDGDTGFVPVAQLLNVSIQLGNSDDVFTLGQTGIPTVFDGGAGNDTLAGTNVAQTWNITGPNSGNIPGATSSFTNVESLRGGTAADSFVFGAAGSLGQTIDGNLGTDTLDNSAIPAHTITPTGPGTLDGFKGTATGVGVGFDNINTFFPSPSSVSGTKTVSGTFAPSGSITYTVVLSNSSTFAQLDNPGNEFTDVLPAGLRLVSANATSGAAVANIGTNTVTWSGSIAGGGSVTITITATINGNAGGTTVSNQGTINYDADGNGTNESSRLTDDPAVGGASDPTSFFVCSNSPVVTTNADSGAGSLRQAIIDACDGATITFDMNQIVTPITLTSAGLVINKNLTITGPGANLLTVQRSTAGGTPQFSVFTINGGKTVSISGLTISNGNASVGGGINNQGSLTLSGCTVSGNSVTGTNSIGGGIANGTTSGTSTLTITNSTISGNAATGTNSIGGGIINTTGSGTATLTIINSTMGGNSATGGGNFGGGIYNSAGGGTATVTITNSTMSGNSASSAGGGIYIAGSGTVTVKLSNTIVAGNTRSGPTPDDIQGTVDPSSSFNVIGNGGAGGLTGVNNNQVGVANALLAPLANNGGPTQTHALLSGSPALDAGSNTLANNAGLTTDQRGTGFARIVDGPDADTTATVDIGAFEAQVSVEDITDKSTNEDTQLQFTFNVGGAASITSVTATSGNTALVPNNAANIALSGSGSIRTLTINPAANQFGTSTITVTVNGANSQSMTDTFVLTVNAVADTPSVTNATTTVNTQTTSGLVISRNPADGAEVTNFKITNITGGTLFKNDGTTEINNGNPFITFAEGNAGLKFTPALNSNANGSFQVQGSLNNTNSGLGGGTVTATITVNCGSNLVTNNNDSGAGSLRDIILHACPGSTITFAPGLVSPITLTTGELVINKNLTINGPGVNTLTISGNNTGRVFNIQAGNTVTVSDLTIANGKAAGMSGGGVLNSGKLTLTNCNLYGNSADSGGAIASLSQLTLNNCNVGGMAAGQPNISLTGGGITHGNGVFPLTINGGSIVGNQGTINGGGIFVTNNSFAVLNGVAISNNAGAFGGGIFCLGTLTVINSTISGNTATGNGGGILSKGTNLTNVTITNNRSDSDNSGGEQGGGIIVGGGTVTMDNTIVAGNFRGTGSTADDIALDVNGTVAPASSFNLIGTGGSGGLTNGVNNNQVGVANARLAPLANNGGPTQTHALLSGSPALDAGSNTLANNAGLTTDQRGTGFARIVDGPDADTTATVDIGAFEAQVSVEDITDKTTNEDTQLQFTFNVGGAASSVTASSANTTLVPNNAANIAVSGSGSTRTLTINPAANQFGTSTITVTVNGANSQSMTDTFVLTVNSVNDAPLFTTGQNQTVNEDAGIQTVFPWATNISAGAANESGQTLTFSVTGNTNPGLFSAAPAISSVTGTLIYTPAANANGSATITVLLTDDGGTANGGQNTSASQTFTITVNPINDAPSFNKGSDQTVPLNAGAQSVPNWATIIFAGPPNESGQTLTFNVTNNTNAGLFSAGPAISSTGTLTYTSANNASGAATITVVLKDNGGTANGGQDTSPSQTFTITINCGPTVVTNNNDSGAGSLRDTIFGACTGSTITFDMTPGHVTSPITLTSGELLIGKGLTITGPGANLLTISGNNSSRVFNVTVASPGVVTFSGLTIANATHGGILNNSNGTINVTNSTLSGNSAVGGVGGGISNLGTGTVNVTNSALSNNSAVFGGGIYNNSTGTINVTNSTLSGNSATNNGGGNGGGIFNFSAGTINVTNSTLSGNSATNGGGIDNNTGSVQIRNSIIALNVATGLGPDLRGTFTTQGHNLIGKNDDSSGFTNGVTADIVGTSVSPINPLLAPLASNGGPTQTMALLAGSPALDAGDDCVTQAVHCGDPNIVQLTTDQRGPVFGRIVDGPDADTTATVDIGAFEAQVGVEDITNKTTNEDTQLQFTFNMGGAASITGVTATSGNTTLVPNNAANLALSGSGSTRTLTINPAANQSGAATITVTVNGANSQSMTDTFVLTVSGVNDPPSFSLSGNPPTINEDAGPQTVPNLATNISAGPPDESGQTLTFQVTGNTNPGLFSAGPTISPSGTLTYTPAANANGSANITIVLMDNGGTANGGQNTSGLQSFTISVNPVNDAPSFSLPGNPPTINEDAGAQTVPNLATNISAGPPDESGQTLNFQVTGNTNPGLFSAGPTISPSGTLTYTPAANANGSANITILLMDNGGTVNGGQNTSGQQTFTITVNPVNDAPSFGLQQAAVVPVNSGAAVFNNFAPTISAGPANEAGQAVNFQITGNTNQALFAVAPAMSPTGTLTFTSANDTIGSANITVVLHDNGGTANGGVDTSAPRTFAINVFQASTSTDLTSAPNPSTVGAPVTFTATVFAGGQGKAPGTVSFKEGATTLGTGTLNAAGVATFATSSLTLGNHSITATYAGNSLYNTSTSDPALVQTVNSPSGGAFVFSAATYTVAEDNGSVDITVNRIGTNTQAVTVDYATSDITATERADYTTALGTLRFAAGETAKTFTVVVSRDAFTEGQESLGLTLSNPTGEATLAVPANSSLLINDGPNLLPNAIDDAQNFVRQHYHDFLNREPDAAGLAFWTNEITSCGNDAACRDIKRINVSAAFFLSIEFQQTGFLVRSSYVAALDRTNNMPRFLEFERDTQAVQRGVIVGQGNWQQTLTDNRDAFLKDFVTRAEFTGLYPTTDTPTQYVDKLYVHAGVIPGTLAERQAAIDEFAGAATAADPGARGRALLRITQNAAFIQREMNRSFVQMEYIGYLRRNPDDLPDGNFVGYNFWLNKLNQFNGNFIQAEMVKSFLVSGEYRQRFGP